MPCLRACIALAALACIAPGTAQPIYKWVDSQGVTHYTAAPPPPGTPATVVSAQGAPRPADAASPVRRDPDRPQQPTAVSPAESAPQRVEPPAAAQQEQAVAAQVQAREAARQVERCGAAREQLEALTRGGPVFRYDAQGHRIYLADDQRDAEIARMIEAVRLDCARLSDAQQRALKPVETALRRARDCSAAREALQAIREPAMRAADSDIQRARDLVLRLCGGIP